MNRNKSIKRYKPSQDFFRAATATPNVSIGGVDANIFQIKSLYDKSVKLDVSLVVFPELCITGYSIQDLVLQTSLINFARDGLVDLARYTKGKNTAAIVGLPFLVGNSIYNCAALLADGEIKGVVPKQNLPTYGEFYEKRWYQSWNNKPNIKIKIGDLTTLFGQNQLFEVSYQLVGIEICEDLWAPEQTSIKLVKNGAAIIANPSASTETVTKSEYRRQLVSNTAARLMAAYIYSSANETESTAETVMSGHAMINEMGQMLAERSPFSKTGQIMIADIDTQHIANDRHKTSNFPNNFEMDIIDTTIKSSQIDLSIEVNPEPFLPTGSSETKNKRLEEILNIQSYGLAMRLKNTKINKVVLGLSGGLDSTLALMVAIRSSIILNMKPEDLIVTLTMPGESSSNRTQDNAKNLANCLKITNYEIPISELSHNSLKSIDHDYNQDVTYENSQARIRQMLVFNKANQINGLALGTGDLSEIALGWCTYNGDHMSHYNVNASIPKSLVKSLVRYAAEQLDGKSKIILIDILDTPISPELTGSSGIISQNTEDIIGPYELHDFFLYHFLRWMEPIPKIKYLAVKAFFSKYTEEEITKWLDVFTKRFYANQWKRQAMPDGAKVGISLSPKGDWRMPPEAVIN